MMGFSHSEGPLTTFVDDYQHMRSLGVVDLDTAILPDVFGVRAFDARKPVVRVLPGQFGNLVRVLVPDAAATPMEFHDIILEDLVSTPDTQWSGALCGRCLYRIVWITCAANITA